MTQPNTTSAETPSFGSLGLSDTVLSAVADMGYEAPTPVQAAAIPAALAGRDVLAAAQTGTGKTAAFLLPTMDRLGHVRRARARGRVKAEGPLMLVVTPTRELAQQIEDVCRAVARRTGHTSVTVVGGVGYNPQKDALKRGCDILIATPGRLQDLIDQGACSLDQVEVLVLDEADRMLDMGFLPAVRRIVGYTRGDRQTLLFSATLDESQVGQITDLVRDPARIEIAPATSTADTVDQYVLPVSLEAKNSLLASVLKREGARRVIVFTRTKHRADACSRRLARAGITAAAIHGNRTQGQRDRALRAFREGTTDVLVATDVLARGIDISDVSYVVNFDVPEDPVDYIHRIGRTGRGGEEGWSLTFVTEDDIDEFYDIEALMGKTVDLFEDMGLDLGANPPAIDPGRVPAKAPAGKKEKKRRRAKNERARRQGRPAPRAASGAEGAGQAAGPSKPSSRKRPGRVRVREQEGSDLELPNEHEAKGEMTRGRRQSPRRRGDSGRGGDPSRRADSPRRGDSGRRAGAPDRARGRDRDQGRDRDAWRNYDEPAERRGRGGRGGRGQGRGASRPRTESGRGNSARRPGDRGGGR